MNVQIPIQARAASVRPASANAEKRTVDLVWSTGAQVRRADWWTGQRYIEELSMDPKHIRLDRLNGGANLIDSHSSWSLRNVLGVVERGWLDGKEGIATVRFSERTEVEPIFRDVMSGIIRNVSVGYMVHRYERIRAAKEGDLDVLRAVDWEPAEISLVAVPADPGAGVRAAAKDGVIVIPCEIRDLDLAAGDPAPANISCPARNARALALMERKLRRQA